MFDAKFSASSIEGDPSDFYEILDVMPDASQAEIRDSYLRIKNTYSKDSVALYTLVDPGEREEILRRVEQAYAALSNPDKRREYDHASKSPGETTVTMESPRPQNVISIDRAPPMETVENAEHALVAPVTDFSFPPAPASEKPASAALPLASAPAPTANPSPAAEKETVLPPPGPISDISDIELEIQAETEWSGAFLRKVREARGIAIEEIVNATRITRAYIVAIEEENISKLPAPVYIRGFVNQVARTLRLSGKDVAPAYMRRCQRLHPEKFL
ncbi:MAG: helix-turn-helix domain-containing protein [Oligoflexia bacterium]|nr:helix-turn-helix domain-containing protein [Oligoflexia bacterium]